MARAAQARKQLEAELAKHPGKIEILGVVLDLSVQADASLAARWLDYQLAGTFRMLHDLQYGGPPRADLDHG